MAERSFDCMRCRPPILSWVESRRRAAMDVFHEPKPTTANDGDRRPWYRLLNRYHWFVLGVAALGWLFDCLDQQLFVLARPAAMRELIPEASISDPKARDIARRTAADYATSIFIAGWATGGLIFGMLGD